MARIRTLGHLQAALDGESGWRTQELGIIKAAIFASSGLRQTALIRAAVPLTYSHWEGFVKKSASHYGNYINSRGLHYADLKRCFLGLESLGIVANLHEIKRMVSTASTLTSKLLDIESAPINIDLWPKLKDVGNLNFEILSEIVDFLNLDYSNYSTKKVFIDETLISTRNKIAHGERLIVDVAAIDSTIDQTIDLITTFKKDIEDSASGNCFLK